MTCFSGVVVPQYGHVNGSLNKYRFRSNFIGNDILTYWTNRAKYSIYKLEHHSITIATDKEAKKYKVHNEIWHSVLSDFLHSTRRILSCYCRHLKLPLAMWRMAVVTICTLKIRQRSRKLKKFFSL